MDDYFARQQLILDSETGERIKTTKVLVIGAGAGGNEVLKNLALMGFGNFTIVDFDPIEKSNLSRATLFTKEDVGKPKSEIAADALNQISLHENPEIKSINAKIQDVGKQVFLDHDIIVCCVDTMDARAYINDWCVRLKKPFFEMGFEKFTVQVSFFPNELQTDSCLRELIGSETFSGARQSCSKLKMKDTNLEHIPTIQVAAALAGVFVATEIILFLKGESRLKNKVLQYAAEYHRSLVIDVPQSPNCHKHEVVTYDIHRTKTSIQDTIENILKELKEKYNSDYYINWGEEYIYSMECESCQKVVLIKKFKSDVFDEERWCSACLAEGHYNDNQDVKTNWKINKELNLFNPKHKFYLQLKLTDFGIKENDIVVAHNLHSNQSKVFILT